MAATAMTHDARTGAVHVHSAYSHDGRDSLGDLRDFARAHGLSFLALTDHAEDIDPAAYGEYVAACQRLSDERVRLIPGLEFRFAGFKGLHLLVLGLYTRLSATTPEQLLAQTRRAPVFTVWAHPILADYEAPPAVAAGVDAVEIWNASYNTRYLPDPRAIAVLTALRRARPEVVGTAGLDQHDRRNDRGTRVVLQRDGGDAVTELKAGRFFNLGRTMRLEATGSMSPMRFAALSAARATFDRLEHVHERVARARAARAARVRRTE